MAYAASRAFGSLASAEAEDDNTDVNEAAIVRTTAGNEPAAPFVRRALMTDMPGRLDRDADAREIGVDSRARLVGHADELHAHAQLLGTHGRHDLARDLHGVRVPRQRERQVDH